MRRRAFIALAGGAAAWTFPARAQPPPMPVIGYLGPESPQTFASRVNAFRDGLAQAGYVEGRNVVIAFRWAEGRYDRLPALAADLVDRQVTLLVAPGGAPVALAAKSATATIPVVFEMGGDPVALGVVRSLNRPEELARFSVRYGIPAVHQSRDFTLAGGLMSYGGDFVQSHRQAGVYAGRIIKGEKPSDLPVHQVTKVELLINLKAAKTLGITFPLSLLARADEVIE